MRRTNSAVVAIVIPGMVLVAQLTAATAADPLSAGCSASTVVTANGISLPDQPSCTTVAMACPAESPGCAFTASISQTAAAGLGASRGRLRITDVGTSAVTDFYCGGPPTQCTYTIPTVFLPAGARLTATCAVTEENILVMPALDCSAAFSPLGVE